MRMTTIISAGLALAFMLGASAAFAQTAPVRVQRLDDSFIDVWVEPPSDSSRAGIVLMAQGSECLSVGPDGDRFPAELPAGTVRMDIEKYAISPGHERDGDACPAAYLEHNTIDGRVIDVLTVLAHLRSEADWWDGRLYLVGFSEGATVAAIVGSLAAETRGVILVNGSVGRPFRDGWAEAVTNAVSSGGGDAATVAAARADVDAAWARARATPTTEPYQGAGNTLRWWRSIIDLRPANLLLNLRAPILLVQTERDQMTPVESAREVVRRFEASGRTNLTYREFPGLDHGFRDADGEAHWGPLLELVNGALTDFAAE